MFKGKLYPQQKPAAEFLTNRKRVLLAWEQGTGKTVISVAAADKLFSLEKASAALVLAPPSFAWQWEDAIKQFTDREVVYVTRTNKEAREYEVKPNTFYVVPWSLFRRDFKKIKEIKWDIVIADEAQVFSNNKSVTADKMRALMLAIQPTYRWLLTGTAVSTKLEELYTLLYVVDRKFLPPWPVFEERHIVRNEFKVIESYKNLKGLHEYLQNRVNRKTHADMVGEMPEIVTKVLTIPPTKEYKHAEATLLDSLDDLVDSLSFDSEGNPNLPNASPVRKAYAAVRKTLWNDKRKSAVIDELDNLLNEHPENRIVVFSDLKQPLYDLSEHYNGPWRKLCTFFTGDQTTEQKRENVLAFKEGKSRILLCSDAGNAGLDLPFARYLININVPPSHGKRDQRNKRIARLSSGYNTVVVVDTLMEDSIEEFLYQVVKARGDLAAGALEGAYDEVVVRPQSLRNFLHGD